jgi:hypothetical protein
MLHDIGFEPEYIRQKIDANLTWEVCFVCVKESDSVAYDSRKLLVMPALHDVFPATYDGVLDALHAMFPMHSADFHLHAADLRSKPISYYHEVADFRFFDVCLSPCVCLFVVIDEFKLQ